MRELSRRRLVGGGYLLRLFYIQRKLNCANASIGCVPQCDVQVVFPFRQIDLLIEAEFCTRSRLQLLFIQRKRQLLRDVSGQTSKVVERENRGADADFRFTVYHLPGERVER